MTYVFLNKEVNDMARLYISKQPDGTFNLRGVRFEGKQLAALEVAKSVPAENLRKVSEEIGDKIAKPSLTPVNV